MEGAIKGAFGLSIFPIQKGAVWSYLEFPNHLIVVENHVSSAKHLLVDDEMGLDYPIYYIHPIKESSNRGIVYSP